MNKGDHVSEHEDKNDSNPRDKRFIFQDFPLSQTCTFCHIQCLKRHYYAERRRALADKPEKMRIRSEALKRENTEHVCKSKMDKHLLHRGIQFTYCATEGH